MSDSSEIETITPAPRSGSVRDLIAIVVGVLAWWLVYRNLATFFGVVAVGILLGGYLFNAIL